MTPFGDIVAIAQRGLFLGNRGSIHRGDRAEIARPWQVRRWITCALQHKGWVAPRWQPGRWTALFYFDEAVALAAGHRPCALCRRPEFVRWMDGWEASIGARPGVDAVDRRLHAERVVGRQKRRHAMPWSGLPTGSFVALGGAEELACLVLADRLLPWSATSDSYGSPTARPSSGTAVVLTPPSTVEVLRHGYVPELHPSAVSY